MNWPDGTPVHNQVLHVRLGCGHECNSRGWRGEEGNVFCCNVCHVLTEMVEISPTDEPPSNWRLHGKPLPLCPGCGTVAGSHHGTACAAQGTWNPQPEEE